MDAACEMCRSLEGFGVLRDHCRPCDAIASSSAILGLLREVGKTKGHSFTLLLSRRR
jgi:hypothetical protein